MPKKARTHLRIDLYNPGSEPWFGPGSDEGLVWYSVLQNEFQYGSVSYLTGASGIAGLPQQVPTIEYLGGERLRNTNRRDGRQVPIGLCLRPFIIPTDVGTWTSIASYDVGTWETLRAYENPPVTYLVQHDQSVNASGTTAYTPWGMQSSYRHPANASWAFSLLPLSVDPAYNPAVGGLSFIQLAWSDARWAIRFFADGNPILMRSNGAGVMIPVMELSAPGRQSHGDSPEKIVGIVRVQRGALLISLDNGATYDVYWDPSGEPVSVPQGHFLFTGQGGAAALGLHRVQYADGTYDSQRLGMEISRVGAPAVTGKYANQTNTAVHFSSIAAGNPKTYAQYRVSLTAGALIQDGRDWSFSPECYVVKLEYPVSPSLTFPTHDGGTTFEGRIYHCEIEKPEELDEGSCTWRARWTVSEDGGAPDLEPFTFRLIQVWGGWEYEDGTSDERVLFTGYISGDPTAQHISPDCIEVSFTASNIALRPKRMKWKDTNCRPYDGYTLNQALALWLNSMGLNDAYAVYPSQGDLLLIPDDFPEEPSVMGEPGNERWSTIHDPWNLCGYEIAVTDDGRYRPVPKNAWNVTTTLYDGAATEEDFAIYAITYGKRILDTYTGVLCRGRTKWGEQIVRWIRDTDAESNIFSRRLRPWSEWHTETIEHPTTPAWVTQGALGLAYEKITPKYPVTLKTELATFISRRDAIALVNTHLTPDVELGVLTLKHVFDRKEDLEAYTEIGAQRIT